MAPRHIGLFAFMNVDDYVRGLAQWPRWEAEDSQARSYRVVALNELREPIRVDVADGVLAFGQGAFLMQYAYATVMPNGDVTYYKDFATFDEVWQKLLEEIWSDCTDSQVSH